MAEKIRITEEERARLRDLAKVMGVPVENAMRFGVLLKSGSPEVDELLKSVDAAEALCPTSDDDEPHQGDQ